MIGNDSSPRHINNDFTVNLPTRYDLTTNKHTRVNKTYLNRAAVAQTTAAEIEQNSKTR